jgi:thiol-disulfide isomerase/thioredoxin
MAALLLLPPLLLAAILALAGTAKLSDRRRFATDLIELGIPSTLAPTVATLVPAAEISVAIALLPAASARWAAVAALTLLTIFTGVIVDARRRGFTGDCNCFGTLAVAPQGRRALARNGALAGLCVLAGWFDGRGAAAVSLGARALTVCVVTAIAVLVLQVQRRAWWPSRAKPTHGENVPIVVFKGLNGETLDLRQTHRRTLLLFWAPGCAPCQYMLPRLRVWESAQPEGAPQLVVVADGSIEANRSAGLQSLISLDPSSQTMRAFGLPGRPSALIVDAGAKLNSAPILGAPAILAALGAPP